MNKKSSKKIKKSEYDFKSDLNFNKNKSQNIKIKFMSNQWYKNTKEGRLARIDLDNIFFR